MQPCICLQECKYAVAHSIHNSANVPNQHTWHGHLVERPWALQWLPKRHCSCSSAPAPGRALAALRHRHSALAHPVSNPPKSPAGYGYPLTSELNFPQQGSPNTSRAYRAA